ncbi:MAG TPA: hypothetical protein VGI20_12310 [Rhizomicrobium sp.]|jgi:hypothetical protein
MPMSESELLMLGHAYNDTVTTAFSQIITITFAMVIGIYYFLNQAKIGLRVFSYIVYSIGMFLYFGLMVASSRSRGAEGSARGPCFATDGPPSGCQRQLGRSSGIGAHHGRVLDFVVGRCLASVCLEEG